MNWTDASTRAGWTFAQSFLAVIVAAGTNFVNVATLKAAAVAGLAAAVSFAKTVAVQQAALPSDDASEVDETDPALD